jgi:hypothetical protein
MQTGSPLSFRLVRWPEEYQALEYFPRSPKSFEYERNDLTGSMGSEIYNGGVIAPPEEQGPKFSSRLVFASISASFRVSTR